MSGAGAAIAEARPKVVAALAAQFRDLDLAEESFAAACEALLSVGEPIRDVPAWLYVTARRKALDIKRKADREAAAGEALAMEQDMAEIIDLPEPIPDERLRLLFVCCHPALAPEARVALALRIVCGVSVEDIASAFVVPTPTMYQRITRAKRKISDAGIPFETPHRRFWPERVASVLGALEVGYSLAYADAAAESEHRHFAEETVRLALMLCELLPEESEVLGFAALVLLAQSRAAARLDADGTMVPLSEQDPAKWNRAAIMQAREMLDQAAKLASPGPHQCLATIHLAHSMRAYGREVDWSGLVALYDALHLMRPGPIVAINRLVALANVDGAEVALAQLHELDREALSDHLPYHAARAHLLREAGHPADAAQAYHDALVCNPGEAERKFLEKRLATFPLDQG